MGRAKKYLTKSINLGRQGEEARYYAEQYLMNHGKSEFSKLIRRLICVHFSDKVKSIDWKKKSLIYEKKKIALEVNELSSKMKNVHKELEKLGINEDEIHDYL